MIGSDLIVTLRDASGRPVAWEYVSRPKLRDRVRSALAVNHAGDGYELLTQARDPLTGAQEARTA
jgi:hypothetical protein